MLESKTQLTLPILIRTMLKLIVTLLLGIASSFAHSADPPKQCESAYTAITKKMYEQALPTLEICALNLKIHVIDRARYRQGRAWALYSIGRTDEAIKEQELAFSMASPSYRLEYINYAVMLRAANRLDDSLHAIEAAERIDEKEKAGPSMMVLYHKGWTLQEMANHREAIKAFTLAIPAQVDFPFVYWKRASSFTAIGNMVAAKEDLSKFSKLFTDHWRKHVASNQLVEYRKKLLDSGLTPAW